MVNENMQQPVSQKMSTPDEAAAALSFATMLSEGLLPKMQMPEGDMMGQEMGPEMMAPQGQPQANETPQKSDKGVDAKFSVLEDDLRSMIKEEIGNLKEMIQQALTEDEEKNGKQES